MGQLAPTPALTKASTDPAGKGGKGLPSDTHMREAAQKSNTPDKNPGENRASSESPMTIPIVRRDVTEKSGPTLQATMQNPVAGNMEMTSPFGMREHPVTGGRKMHHGIDFVGDPTIVAALPGRVVEVGYSSEPLGKDPEGYGNYIVIQHSNGTQTLYGHLKSVSVKEGDVVKGGEKIAIMGTTGRSTGVHLHFEVQERQGGQWIAVDPGKYLGKSVAVSDPAQIKDLSSEQRSHLVQQGRLVVGRNSSVGTNEGQAVIDSRNLTVRSLNALASKATDPKIKEFLTKTANDLASDTGTTFDKKLEDALKISQVLVGLGNPPDSVSVFVNDYGSVEAIIKASQNVKFAKGDSLNPDGVHGPRTERALRALVGDPITIDAQEFIDVTNGKWKAIDYLNDSIRNIKNPSGPDSYTELPDEDVDRSNFGDMFGSGPYNSPLMALVGAAEGNLLVKGGKIVSAASRAGHNDPESGYNVGIVSAQDVAGSTPGQADIRWHAKLKVALAHAQQGMKEAGLNEKDPLLLAAYASVYVQSPEGARVDFPKTYQIIKDGNQTPQAILEGMKAVNEQHSGYISYWDATQVDRMVKMMKMVEYIIASGGKVNIPPE
jgi:Peptidase family M23